MRTCSLCVVLLLVLLAAPAAQARDVTFNDGPAVGLGLGSDAGNTIGVFAGYYLTWPERRLSVMAHVGTGVPILADDSGFYLGSMVPWSLGAMVGYGKRHRFIADLHAFSLEQTLELYGERIEQRQDVGLGLAFGWELLTGSGFFLRTSIGPAYFFLPPLYQRSDRWSVTANIISIGAKLW